MKKFNTYASSIGQPRLLIIGCGDIGLRLLPLLRDRFRIFAVVRQAAQCAAIRAAGAIPIVGDLMQPASLARLARLASTIIYLAPPSSEGQQDKGTRHLVAILPERTTLVYISTTGVYGDCQGAYFNETRPIHPMTPRAQRRADAERTLRQWARRTHSRLSILRVPGIYAPDRLPIARLQRGTPALAPAEDVYTNHIHAEDLAHLIKLALWRGAPCRVYHAVDDSQMKMGDYLDQIAETWGYARPPRVSRAELEQQVTPLTLSFMSESRRLDNTRAKAELGMRLRYPLAGDKEENG